MSIDLRHVADVNRSRFAVDGPSASTALGRLSVMRDGDRGETIVPKHQPIATRLASQSSAIRLRLSGAAAVLSISMETDEEDLLRDYQTIVDLTDSKLGAKHLAVIMRWLCERLSAHSGATRPLTPGGLSKWRLRRVLTYIDQHICEPITLATLAEVAGLSRMYFAAQFRAATGCRPHECVLRKRIQRAERMLLETSEPLASIALLSALNRRRTFPPFSNVWPGSPLISGGSQIGSCREGSSTLIRAAASSRRTDPSTAKATLCFINGIPSLCIRYE